MISAAALLWCAAMAVHLANADVPTALFRSSQRARAD